MLLGFGVRSVPERSLVRVASPKLPAPPNMTVKELRGIHLKAGASHFHPPPRMGY